MTKKPGASWPREDHTKKTAIFLSLRREKMRRPAPCASRGVGAKTKSAAMTKLRRRKLEKASMPTLRVAITCPTDSTCGNASCELQKCPTLRSACRNRISTLNLECAERKCCAMIVTAFWTPEASPTHPAEHQAVRSAPCGEPSRSSPEVFADPQRRRVKILSQIFEYWILRNSL